MGEEEISAWLEEYIIFWREKEGEFLYQILYLYLGLNVSHTESLANIVEPFTTAELLRLMEAVVQANITEKDFLVLNTVLSDPNTKVADVYR
jgi:hypothetical protein